MAKKSKKNNDKKLYYKYSIPIAILIVVVFGVFIFINSSSDESQIYDSESDVADDMAFKESALSGKAAASSRANGGIRGDTCESADECQLGLTCRKRVPNRYRNGRTIPRLDRNFAYREDSKCANKMWDNYPCAYHTQCKSGYCSEEGRCKDAMTSTFVSTVESQDGKTCNQACNDRGYSGCLLTIGAKGESIYEYSPGSDYLTFLYDCNEGHRNGVQGYKKWCLCAS